MLSPQLPKLSPPRLFDALPRPRLFAQLDALRARHPVVWITAPPGAGKTTLVASYLEHTGTTAIWFQVDDADADPATFFHYLAATHPPHTDEPPLPWLAPELAGDIPRFARRFFRAYFARLAPGAVLVFDNAQDCDTEHWRICLEVAFAEVPDGVTLLVLSREAPLERIARLELTGRVGVLKSSALRLDETEARAFLGIAADVPTPAWLHLAEGWAAGLVMLREHLDSHGTAPDPATLCGHNTVFRFFAAEILSALPPASQRSLMVLSCLQDVTVTEAQLLSDDANAGTLLERLFRAQLFITRRDGTPPTYHFHALFRAFLRHEAEIRLPPAERRELLLRAARIATQRGDIEDAARLYQAAEGHAELVTLLCQQAAVMLQDGRGSLWREWAASLPESYFEAEPWLLYWQGCSLNHTDPAQARTLLQRALHAFAAHPDSRVARLLTLAALIDSDLYEWNGNIGLPPWTEALLTELDGVDHATLDANAAVTVHSRLCMALAQYSPGHPALPVHAQAALQRLPQIASKSARLAAGTYLLEYLVSRDREQAQKLFEYLHPLSEDAAVSPLYRVWWFRPASLLCLQAGDHATAHALYQQGRHLAAEFGLPHLHCHFNARLATHALRTGNATAAATLVAEIRRNLRPDRPYDLLYVRMLETALYAQQQDITAALAAAKEADHLGVQVAASVRQCWQVDAGLAFVYVQRGESGDAGRALERIERAIKCVEGLDREEALDTRDLLRALIARHPLLAVEARSLAGSDDWLAQAEETAVRRLVERRGHVAIMPSCFPHLLQPLLAAARAQAPQLPVRTVISALASPPPAIAVRVFGPLQLLRNGVPVHTRGKAQQRPLLLLKALALAAGVERPAHALAVQLWPDSETPKAALNVTLHRLRKLLGDAQLVQVAGGLIRLDCTRLSLDLIELDEACTQIERLAPHTSIADARRLGELILELYRGPCCEGDDLPWLLPVRAHWQQRFTCAIEQLGVWLEAHGTPRDAAHLYSRALQHEALAENLHRGLMRCAAAQGNHDAVTASYQRCVALLQAALNRSPSPLTQQLHATLMASVSDR